MQRGQQIGFFGVLVLVALRVAAGWHFFDQGLDKFDPSFSSEGLLRNAKGPLAEVFQSLAHGVHGVDTRLFVPRAWTEETAERLAAQPGWQRAYEGRLKRAEHPDPEKRKPITEIETPPPAPFSDWLEQITADWERCSTDAAQLAGGDDQAKQACREVFLAWQGRLAAYLSSQAEAMAEHQNELWRLEQLEQKAAGGALPYNDERAEKKAGETFYTSRQWVANVRSLEAGYRRGLAAAATDGGADADAVASAVEPTTRLDVVNQIVKWSVVSIGACLMLGFCTRPAAVGGALFLCSVIATQPPWVHGANTQYFWYQLVEVAALLTIAVFGAGRWLGVDAVIRGLRKVN